MAGESTPEPPGDQTFWVAQVTTEDADELTWEVESGDWTVVMMNADASRGVDVDARLGIKVDWLLPALIGLLALGLVLLAGGTLLVIFASRGQAEPGSMAGTSHTGHCPHCRSGRGTVAGRAVSARPHQPLEPSLSRGLWLSNGCSPSPTTSCWSSCGSPSPS